MINDTLFLKFVTLACERLNGDWVVIGGTVLFAMGLKERTTIDIDLAGPEESSQKDQFTLMEIAGELGLPVEAINQAGAFFLHKIADWESNLVLLKSGPSVRILRPNTTLFVLLKIQRLSEIDLEDCLNVLKSQKIIKDPIDCDRIRHEVKVRSKQSKNAAEKKRLSKILEGLVRWGQSAL